MEIRERIAFILKTERLSASIFADQIGVQRSSISHVLSGRNKPSLDYLQKILHNFPNYSAEWLVIGVGNPKKDQVEPNKDLFTPKVTTMGEPTINKVEPRDEKPITEPIEPKAPLVEPIIENPQGKAIDKVIIFYSDGSFKAYNN